MKYKIVDNFFQGEDFDGIVDTMTNDQEFYFVDSITGGESDQFTSYGFGCNFVTIDQPGKYYCYSIFPYMWVTHYCV